MVKNKGDKMKKNIDTLINEEMNENEDKNEIELIYKKSLLLDNYTLIKINGKLLKDIRIRDLGFCSDFSGNRDLTLSLKIPLDKYKIIINPDSEEKEKKLNNYNNKVILQNLNRTLKMEQLRVVQAYITNL